MALDAAGVEHGAVGAGGAGTRKGLAVAGTGGPKASPHVLLEPVVDFVDLDSAFDQHQRPGGHGGAGREVFSRDSKAAVETAGVEHPAVDDLDVRRGPGAADRPHRGSRLAGGEQPLAHRPRPLCEIVAPAARIAAPQCEAGGEVGGPRLVVVLPVAAAADPNDPRVGHQASPSGCWPAFPRQTMLTGRRNPKVTSETSI